MIPRSVQQDKGKALRKDIPRSSHGEWSPAADRPDPIQLLRAQDKGRLQRLLPIKYGRMVASPFAFLRGSAVVMAADLAQTPVTGMDVILCGDAHLSNFGVFASPERKLVFDINDFDEAYPGPWEWDLKRLAASAVVAGRENGFSEKTCRNIAGDVARVYATAVKRFAKMSTLDVWYYHVEAETVQAVFEKAASKAGEAHLDKILRKAQSKTQEQTLVKLTHMAEGRRRIVSDPPLLVPFQELKAVRLLTEGARQLSRNSVVDSWQQYLASLPDERRYLLRRFRIIDIALRVGGVGSVGTRCFIILLEGEGQDDALILQLKEAGPSVIEPFMPQHLQAHHAERVVTAQQLVQATSDIFLGWHASQVTDHKYYWRQLKDMKGSIDATVLDKESFKTYLGLCSVCLARAHARTGDAAMISGYLGTGKRFAQALAEFAVAYADQTVRDHQMLVEAIQSGRIIAETGI